MTSADVERLLSCQPLLDVLGEIDPDAVAERLVGELEPDLMLLLCAGNQLAAAGLGEVMRAVQRDVRVRLNCEHPQVITAAEHAAVATAFSDVLDPETCAALSLPWALGATLAN